MRGSAGECAPRRPSIRPRRLINRPMDNYQQVLHQMEDFGVEFLSKDLPLTIDAPKRKGCGKKGKWWYWLRTFRPAAGGCYVVGRFGSYKTGTSQKVEVDWAPLGEAKRARMKAERVAAQARADAARAAEAELAALSAAELWALASREGQSPYLDRKGVAGESCRYLAEQLVLRWPARDAGEADTVVRLPAGTLVVPLLRYDMPRDEALRGLQFIRPDGAKIYTRGFAKPGCAVRLGHVDPGQINLVLICEGFATGLTLRMATECQMAVYVALDAGNLQHVVPLVAALHPTCRLLVCADDDWRTREQNTGDLSNPGRSAARAVAKQVPDCDFLWPVFAATTRKDKDTDFNDLHARQGLDAVRRQIMAVVQAMGHKYG